MESFWEIWDILGMLGSELESICNYCGVKTYLKKVGNMEMVRVV